MRGRKESKQGMEEKSREVVEKGNEIDAQE
jgi:hypothetical protein